MPDAVDDLPTVRLEELVEALRVALGGGHGWIAAAARLLGVTPAYISRLRTDGDPLRVGSDVVKRVGKQLGISRGFFLDPDHEQSAAAYAALVVPQTGLPEIAPAARDHRRAALDALTRIIAAAEYARTAVLEGLPVDDGAITRIGTAATSTLVELGAYRERVSRG